MEESLTGRMEKLPNGDKTEGNKKLEKWLNKNLKIQMTDGRTLIGIFVCTDKDRNIILGSCQEYLHEPGGQEKEEPRILGLAMIPGHHIVSICVDESPLPDSWTSESSKLRCDIDTWNNQQIL